VFFSRSKRAILSWPNFLCRRRGHTRFLFKVGPPPLPGYSQPVLGGCRPDPPKWFQQKPCPHTKNPPPLTHMYRRTLTRDGARQPTPTGCDLPRLSLSRSHTPPSYAAHTNLSTTHLFCIHLCSQPCFHRNPPNQPPPQKTTTTESSQPNLFIKPILLFFCQFSRHKGTHPPGWGGGKSSPAASNPTPQFD